MAVHVLPDRQTLKALLGALPTPVAIIDINSQVIIHNAAWREHCSKLFCAADHRNGDRPRHQVSEKRLLDATARVLASSPGTQHVVSYDGLELLLTHQVLAESSVAMAAANIVRQPATPLPQVDRLQMLADQAPVLIAIGNDTQGLYYANPAWSRLTGAGIEELGGAGWLAYVQFESDTANPEIFSTESTELGVGGLRCLVCDPDGRRHPMHVWRFQLNDDNLTHPDIVVIATENTTRLQSADPLALALDAAKAGMWDWRVDRRTFVANDRLHTMLGESPVDGEESFQWFVDRVHPDDVDRVNASIEAAHRDDSFEYNHEFRMKHANGGYRWIRTQGRVVERDTHGHPVRMIGLHIDVTAQKEAERSLRNAIHEAKDKRDRLSEILQYSKAAIAIYDRDMRFLAVSERWRTDYDLVGKEIIGRSVYTVMKIPDRWREVHERCLEGAIESCEKDFWIKPDGEKKWERWDVRPWFDVSTDEIAGLTIFTEDITEQMALEAKIVSELDELARANRLDLINQVGIHLAHELRHPLAELVNNAYVVAEKVKSELGQSHPVSEDLHRLQTLALGVSKLIGDLVLFAGKESAKRERVVVGEAIKSVLPLLDSRIRSAGVSLNFVNEAPSASIFVDLRQLQQVAVNVLLNAIESIQAAQHPEGMIDIRISTTVSSHARIAVTDNGPGIRAEDAAKTFARFQTTKADGMGVGLAISQEIVDSNDGRIYFQSLRPAIIHIEFPLIAEGRASHG